MPYSEPTSVNASADATARSSAEHARISERRLSRLDRFQASRPSSGKFNDDAVPSDEQRTNADTGGKHRPFGGEQFHTTDKLHERLSLSFRKSRINGATQQPQERSVEGSQPVTRSNSNPARTPNRSSPPLTELEPLEPVRYETPDHFKGPREIGAHAALSSNPVGTTSAPLKPLPSLPNVGFMPSTQDKFNDLQKMATDSEDNEYYYDASPNQIGGAERASNQGVRRTSHEQFTKALFAPIDRGNDLRSLHAMSSYLRRGDSNASYQEIPESSGLEDVDPPSRDEKSSATAFPNYSRPSALRDDRHRRASIQRDRNELVRARKLRDLQRGRYSVDENGESLSRPSTRGSLPGSRPGSRNMLRENATGRQSRLEPSPDITEEGDTTLHGPSAPTDDVILPDQWPRPNDKYVEMHQSDATQLSGQEQIKPGHAAQSHISRPQQLTETDASEARTDLGPKKKFKHTLSPNTHEQDIHHSHNRYRDVSDTLPTIISATTEKFPTPSDESPTKPESTSRAEGPHTHPDVLSESRTREPTNEPLPRTGPKSPTTSTKSNKSAKEPRTSKTPSQLFDPHARLQARVELLERENKLLEAALMAVLKTNGKLNGCPCGGTLKSPGEGGRPQSNAAKPVRAGRQEYEGERLDVKHVRNSVVSNATSAWSDESAVAGRRPLDLYMATRAGHRISYDPSGEPA